jgi:glycosyltransferase involved in cell wall biosynthesis
MSPTVSVIIPAYNAAEHVGRAVESALNQTLCPLEVLVVDDGSKDRTTQVVAAMPSPVRLICKENGGPASARNLGAGQAKGDWLALLDADDWWYPEKLQAQLAVATDPDCGLVHCLPDHRHEQVPAELTFEDLWQNNWVINSSVLIRRSLFEEQGGFNEARDLISVEDYNLWIRVAASRRRILTCPQVLVHYTRGIGISSNSERFMRASLYNIEDLGRRLSLPEELVARKYSDTLFAFGRRALFERDMPLARRLFWRVLKRETTVSHGLHLLASTMPRPILDIRRSASRLLIRSGDSGSSTGNAANDILHSSVNQPQCGTKLSASILDRTFHTAARDSVLPSPVLMITIDAEEDFDWTRPLSRSSTSVTSMRSQHLAHRVFERYNAIPTYLVDHPVASQDEGRAPLKELLTSGHCGIGAQLHPWVTPPFVESVSPRNSFPGNLPVALEFAKIQALTAEIQAAFGRTPRIFRAGRYGVGCNTGQILRQFGYLADTSVVPCWNFGDQDGPDFSTMQSHPYWIDRDCTVLELPLSAALVGRASRLHTGITSSLFNRNSERFGLPSVMARLGLLERIKLTPEGIAIEEAKRLVRNMVSTGHKVFILTYHSPSLEPGNTPYVRTVEERDHFLRWLDEFLDFFTTEIGGDCETWETVVRRLRDVMPAGN